MSAEVANGHARPRNTGEPNVLGANRFPQRCANDEHFQFEPVS